MLTPEGEPGLNYLCPGLRVFYDHAGKRLAEHGRARYTAASPAQSRSESRRD
jgi:hypothetical protein